MINKQQLLFLLPIIVLFIRCGKKNEGSDNIVTDSALYLVTFSFQWNEQDFPVDYPSNAHFSKLIGWSHKPMISFFQEGTLASEGIENMAETGGTSPLDEEINTGISDGKGLELVIGDYLIGGTGEIRVEIVVDIEHSAVTLATMLAPSPDWYVAVVDIPLYVNEEFIHEKVVHGLVYDAGTDNGTTFTSEDDDADPQQPISLLRYPPLGNGISVKPPISTVTFLKQ